MPKSSYSDLADSIAAGGWESETPHPRWKGGPDFTTTATTERMQTACLIDIMQSLRRVARVLECRNVQAMAKAAVELKNLVKGEVARPKPKRPARRTRR